MTTPKRIPTRLTIQLPTGYTEIFLNLCDAFNLSRDQLFMLLMVDKGLADGGQGMIFADEASKSEWSEFITNKIFKIANSLP